MNFEQYFKSVKGKSIDYDGVYGVQCFDLANSFIHDVYNIKNTFTGMYAYQIYTDFDKQPCKSKFTKIVNTPDYVPKKGDIIVWSKDLNGTAGHVAVATGEGDETYFYSYDQNWTGHNEGVTRVKHNYNCVLGALRYKTATKKPTKKVPPKKYQLKSVRLYTNAYALKHITLYTGDAYCYDNEIVNGKRRITNNVKYIGKKPMETYVTGWVRCEVLNNG